MRTKKVFFAVAVALLGASAAFAGFAPVGDPFEFGSWSQGFTESGVGLFNHFQMKMVAPDLWDTPGIAFAGGSGWAQTYDNGTLLIANGTPTTSLGFTLNFAGSTTHPFTAYLQAWNGTTLVDDMWFHWGPGWSFGQPSGWQTGLIPVPGAALLGVIGLGLVGWVKRRMS